MSLQAEHDLIGSDGDWVTIVHPETGGTHTCVREAFEDVYKDKGWVLALDPQADTQPSAEEVAAASSGQVGDDPEGRDE